MRARCVFGFRSVFSGPGLVSSCNRAVHVSPQMWEKAIELGKQLAKMHEIHMFDFMELSQLLVRGWNSAVQTGRRRS